MELQITNSDELDLDKFCSWLVEYMQAWIFEVIDEKQLTRFDAFLNNNNIVSYMDRSNRLVSSKNILIGSTYNLKVEKVNNKYLIHIDTNAMIPNTYSRFIDIVKFIDEGNLSIPAYPIYSDMMSFFAKHLQEFYEEFLILEFDEEE